MMRLAIVFVLVLGWTVTAAAQSRKAAGWWTVVAGAGVTALAFNYKRSCERGYRLRSDDYGYDTCITTYEYRNETRIEDTPIKARLARPGMLWTGIGMIGGGFVVALWPSAPAFTVEREGWRVEKRLSW